MSDITDFYDEEDLLTCYPLWIMLIIYVCIYILLAIYVPIYFKILWSTPSMILSNIINIFISSMIFYSLCKSDKIGDGKKRITAMVILFYPVITALLYFIFGITTIKNTVNTVNTVNFGGKKKKN